MRRVKEISSFCQPIAVYCFLLYNANNIVQKKIFVKAIDKIIMMSYIYSVNIGRVLTDMLSRSINQRP